MRLLDNSFRTDFNSIRINTHNNLTHELAKTIKAYELIKEGYTILTEATFKSGGRADILIMEKFMAIEILDSETEERFSKKLDTYPEELDIVPFYAEDIIDQKCILK
jgi:hypothetical protein